jgi:hypothetical protein
MNTRVNNTLEATDLISDYDIEDLDDLVQEIFELIDTYYIEKQAIKIEKLIQLFVEQQIAERQEILK